MRGRSESEFPSWSEGPNFGCQRICHGRRISIGQRVCHGRRICHDERISIAPRILISIVREVSIVLRISISQMRTRFVPRKLIGRRTLGSLPSQLTGGACLSPASDLLPCYGHRHKLQRQIGTSWSSIVTNSQTSRTISSRP